GTVLTVGTGVESFKPGDWVYTTGTLTGAYAEMTVANAKSVHPLPDNLSFEEGAGIGIPFAAAYRALFQRADAKPGETVLVHGASGGVGVAATQMAKAKGMMVIGTAGTPGGLVLAQKMGADHTVDHTSADHGDVVMKLTAGRGVDVILEMLANENLGADLRMLADKGRVVVIGSRGDVNINPRDLMARESAILGMMVPKATQEEREAMDAGIGEMLREGKLRPVVGKVLPLKDAARAHTEIIEGDAHGKIILKVGE
ncbi:MAG TPA: NADPH:quinone reductase, partial [Nitrospirota bacterium]